MIVTIREALESDLEKILNLYRQPGMDDGKALTPEQAKEVYRKMKTYPDYKLYVAVKDGEVVGTFALAVMDNLAHLGAPSGLIEDVAVTEELRGEGIGKQMMNYAAEYCKKRGCYKVALSSNLRREKAHRFYESLGFVKHGYSFLLRL